MSSNWKSISGTCTIGSTRAATGRSRSGGPTYRKLTGGRRPLGVTALEDKIVQGAVAELLNAVYEADFRECSYGFRPRRSAHDALRATRTAIVTERANWIVDADIRNFFGSVDHSWLERMIARRIADPRILRLTSLWLKAGVLEDEVIEDTVTGTPQGAGISPILANICLHYVLDLWAEQWGRRYGMGRLRLVRFADDFLLLRQERGDAERLMAALRERLAKFGLALHEGKTRLIEFGRFAAANRARRGEGRPETFAFLGFTFYYGSSRTGGLVAKLKTQRTRLIRKLKELRVEMKKRRHEPVADQSRWLGSVLRGHYGYFGITGNADSIGKFHRGVVLWRRWVLRRRGHDRSFPGSATLRSLPVIGCRHHASFTTGAPRRSDRDTRWKSPVRESRTPGSVEGGRRATVASTRPVATWVWAVSH